jgi:SP family arabinose:H+ symporter-like MFS transporter
MLNSSILQIEVSLDWPANLDNFRLGLASALLPGGALFGALAMGYFADVIGRRWSLIIADVLLMSTFVMTYDSYFPVFCIGRFFEGMTYGFNSVGVPLYLREIAPPDLSGKMVGCYKIFFCIGLTLSYAMAFTLPLEPVAGTEMWKVMYGLPAAFALLRVIGFFTVVTFDTPKYYLITGQDANMRNFIDHMYTKEVFDSVYKRELKHEKSVELKEIFSPKYKKQLLLALFVYFVGAYMGTNCLNYFSTIIFMGTNAESATLQTPQFYMEVRILNLCIGIIRIITAVLGSWLADKAGRRFMYLLGDVMLVAILFAFAGFGFGNLGLEQRICVLLMAAAFGLTFITIGPIFISEVLPSKGISLVISFDCLNQVIFTLCFAMVVDTPTRTNICFLVFGAIGVIAFPILYLYFKETRRMTLPQILNMFNGVKEDEEDTGLINESNSEANESKQQPASPLEIQNS